MARLWQTRQNETALAADSAGQGRSVVVGVTGFELSTPGLTISAPAMDHRHLACNTADCTRDWIQSQADTRGVQLWQAYGNLCHWEAEA